jgi:hypothetical protein
VTTGELQAFGAAIGNHDLMSVHFQRALQGAGDKFVIIDYEDCSHCYFSSYKLIYIM